MPHYGEELHTSDGSISSLLLKKEGLNTAHKNASTNEGKDFGV